MAVEALSEQLQRLEAARQRAAVLWQDDGLAFTTAHGTQLDAADVRRSLRTICRKAGIGEEWTPRELRHTFVSLLSDNGMAIEEISRLVGHSSSNVTHQPYGLDQVDQIVVLDHGRVAEQGTHQKLRHADGPYQWMRDSDHELIR